MNKIKQFLGRFRWNISFVPSKCYRKISFANDWSDQVNYVRLSFTKWLIASRSERTLNHNIVPNTWWSALSKAKGNDLCFSLFTLLLCYKYFFASYLIFVCCAFVFVLIPLLGCNAYHVRAHVHTQWSRLILFWAMTVCNSESIPVSVHYERTAVAATAAVDTQTHDVDMDIFQPI